MGTKSPNVWNVGDRAVVQQGRFMVPVKVIGFDHDQVRVRYQDGTEGLRGHRVLRRQPECGY